MEQAASNSTAQVYGLHSQQPDQGEDFVSMGKAEAIKFKGSVAAFLTKCKILLEEEILKAAGKEEAKRNSDDSVGAKKRVLEETSRQLKEKKETLEKELKAALERMTDIIKNPRARDTFWYYTYMVAIVLLTVYLFIFYTSVVYSAFFREISISSHTVFNSVFYPKSLAEAMNDFGTFMIVVLCPTIFISLGMVMHQMSADARDAKRIASLIGFAAVTFVMDALLAYHICERIYAAKSMNSMHDLPPYSGFTAMLDLNFWLIIFFGYVTYILLGRMLKYFEIERNEVARVNKEKLAQETVIDSITESLNKVNEDINTNQIDMQQVSEKHDDTVYFSSNSILKKLNEIMLGWMEYLTECKATEEEINNVKTSLDEFCAQNIKVRN